MNFANLIDKLRKKYRRISFIDCLKEKYSNKELSQSTENIITENIINKKSDNSYSNICLDSVDTLTNTEEEYLTFTSDKDSNLEIIKRLKESILCYKEKITSCTDEECALKIVDKYISGLSGLEENKYISDPEKISKGLKRYLGNFLLNLYQVKSISVILFDYISKNKFKTITFEKGHKLTDDEIALLDSDYISIYTKKAENMSDRYKVIEMIKPAIEILYINEDDEIEYCLIPGICRFYA